MESLVQFFEGIGPVRSALLASIFTWLMTALGASSVLFFKTFRRSTLDAMLGFTGGVMIAASFWSLLNPALDMAKGIYGSNFWIYPVLGFSTGALFLFLMDKITPHLHINFGKNESEGLKTDWHSTTLLVLAITIHNIPEGLAVGVLFGAAFAGVDGATIPSAIALAIGMGIQNFPEGVAVAFPLRRMGVSRRKSFMIGQLSAVVEPIAAVIGAMAVFLIQPLLPFAMCFAAGAMIYIVIEEVIPETQKDKHTDIAVLSFILGFVVMMILDTAIV